jgi:transcriptional regulator with XRE-family HTH domain
MNATELRQVRGELLAKGHTMASIAAELGLSRQHVRRVLIGAETSARVRQAIAARLGRDPLEQRDAGDRSAPPAA